MTTNSLDKSKIKFLLLEGLHPSALQVLQSAGYSQIESLSGALPQEELGPIEWGKLINALVPPLLLIGAVLGSILAGYATPTEAAALGALGAAVTVGFANCASRCTRGAFDYLWPIIVDRTDGQCH